MEDDNDEQEHLAPEDDWDLPQPPRASPPTQVPRSEAAKPPPRPEVAKADDGAVRGRSPGPAAKAKEPMGKFGMFPGVAARSGLFRIGRTEASPLIHAGPVPSQGRYGLSLFGPWPTMADKPAWEAVIELARRLGDPFEKFPVNLSEIAAMAGRSDTGGAALASIWRSMERLASCRVELLLPTGTRVGGHLLGSAEKTGRSRRVQLDRDLAEALFREDRQFKIDRARRASLDCGLSRWLHDFLSTHEQRDKPLTVDYLRGLCGHAGESKRFPGLLRRALSELQDKAPGLLLSHAIEEAARSSDRWRISLGRGPESPEFSTSGRKRRDRCSEETAAPSKARRRAGPAL